MTNKVGIYIHIPYCKRKCFYCSFYSIESDKVAETLFLRLLEDISTYEKEGILVDTVYIGGGTPSLLDENQIERLFSCLNKTFILDNPEISIELNPESVTDSKLRTLANCGVNRVSFGVQSFSNNELSKIRRLHSAEKAVDAIRLAKKYFDNINIDLMVGLPDQTIESLKFSLDTLEKLDVSHCSVYSLILEENTPLFQAVRNGLVLPNSDETVDAYDFAVDYLKKIGLNRYEISNFARNGKECKHNLNCWNFHEYIGFGAGAHSFYKNVRYSYPDDLDGYLSGTVAKTIYPVDNENSRAGEYIMLALRTKSGVNKKLFSETFSLNFDEVFAPLFSKKEIKDFCVNGLDNFYVKEEYFYISNSIIVDFLEILE